ncbi:MAG: GspE/PulE family protein [Desulfobulbaceae bacterium]|nr:GspE/PulE family protein [Desulfobulbaceae bacterium]
MNPTVKPKRIGDVLIEKGYISADQLTIALYQQKKIGKPLGEVLLDMGFVNAEVMLEIMAEIAGYQSIDLTVIVANAMALSLIPKHFALKHTLFPVSFDNETGEVIVATVSPEDIVVRDALAILLAEANPAKKKPLRPVWRIAPRAEVLTAIDHFYNCELSLEGILAEMEDGKLDITALTQAGISYSHPIVRLVDAIMADAVSRGASDIHFEPEDQFLRIRYRIDGVMRSVRSLAKSHWTAILVRLKVVAKMNISESRAPQDGRISLSLFGRHINFRAAVQPTIHGENFVLQILDRKLNVVALDKLGLTEEQLSLLKRMLEKPEGILLVTGPTGSGKTTTLYSVLGHLNNEGVNIMTLEDPVEYPLPLIRQTSLSEAVKLNFSEGIRSLMRQDPDIIFIGEIRDQDTAEMAIRAAMTGHQVFSTLHTNSAIRSIPRLLDLGIRANLFAGNMIGIIAQRLVRKLCPHCKVRYRPGTVERKLMGINKEDPLVLYRAGGCPACEGQGYKGRMAIMEILRFDGSLDELVARQAGLKELEDYALTRDFVPIAKDGIRRVREGLTSLSEVRRVVDLSERLAD